MKPHHTPIFTYGTEADWAAIIRRYHRAHALRAARRVALILIAALLLGCAFNSCTGPRSAFAAYCTVGGGC